MSSDSHRGSGSPNTGTSQIQILGGGPAGLGAAWFARQNALPFRLYEASNEVGGNCRTLRTGPFLYDTGAHRLHDKDPDVTALIRELLRQDLLPVGSPSAILHRDRFVDFPLHLSGLLRALSPRELIRITSGYLARNSGEASDQQNPSFQDQAIRAYGRQLAEMFLLNYSKKLWGMAPEHLSPQISGGRLKGLNFASFLRTTFTGNDRGRENIDGRFYYPRYGIGMIADALAEGIGMENIQRGTRITALPHDGNRITGIELNGAETIPAGTVVSTLPLTVVLRSLRPAPPDHILEIAGRLKFRNLLLLAFGIRRDALTNNASIYIPDASEPFTRLYESKNRSPFMAPEGMTSVVLELPCQQEDPLWNADPEELKQRGADFLRRKFAVDPAKEIEVFALHRIPFAYPVLETGFEETSRSMTEYLKRFSNLLLTGRSALFRYTHIHDLLKAGKETIRSITG